MSTEVLHSTWLPTTRRFFLWGESADQISRKGRQPKIAAHPFGSSPAQLREYLERHSLPATNLEEQALTIWLPSAEKGPILSPELLSGGGVNAITRPKGGVSQVELRAWQVTGLACPPWPAVDLLLALGSIGSLGSVWSARGLGADLRAWHLAALLAMEVVAAQEMMPALARDGYQLRALWRLRLTLERAQKMAALARALPPLVRAVTDDPARAPSPRALLDDFVSTVADATMRELRFKPLLSHLSPATAGGKWLGALLGDDPIVPLKGSEADELFKAWQRWSRQGFLAGDEVFRVTFRLEPPKPEGNGDTPRGDSSQAHQPWSLSYLLQATDDPSLLVPASSVWREKGRAATFLKRHFEQPQERLLAALGYAARLFPPIEASLKEAAPARARFGPGEAFSFLKEAVPLLEQSGFGVLVPSWWTGKGARLQARARAKMSSKGANEKSRLSLDTLVSFDWEITLGDEPIDHAEFERLVALKMPLVQVRGQWVVLDPEHLQKALAFFDRHGWREQQMPLFAAMPLLLDPQAQAARQGVPQGMELSGVVAEGWLHDLLAQLSDTQQLHSLPEPEGLRGKLRPYQQRGYSWLAFLRRTGFGACLADDMGLGKCVGPDTLISVNGTLIPAEAVWDSYARDAVFDGEGFWATPAEPLHVHALDEETGRIVQAPVNRIYRQYVKEQLHSIELEDGSSIKITRRHRLLTRDGWTNRFAIGDYVCVPARLPWAGEHQDHDLMKLLAWQIAEGHERTERARVMITQKNPDCLEDLRAAIRHIGDRYVINVNKPAIYARQRVFTLVVSSKEYRAFLETRGYRWGAASRHKVIPPFVMQADSDCIQVFLRHYFDAEGSAIFGMASVEISSASALLMQQLAALLRRFGIWLRISAKQKHATNGSKIARTYYIGVIGGNSARRFFHQIGFGDARKQQELAKICSRACNTNVEGVPVSDLVANAVSVTHLPLRHMGMHNTVYVEGSQQFSRGSLENVVAALDRILSGETEAWYRQQKRSKWTTKTLAAYENLDYEGLVRTRSLLRTMLDREVHYCRIKAIRDLEYEGWVYDLEVDGYHNFVASNILCHNTIQAITLLLHEREHLAATAPALLVCPTSVVGNWVRELERFAPSLRVAVHHGADRKQGKEFRKQIEGSEGQDVDVVLTSYPLLARDRETLADVPWGTVVLDEAQNIKNASTKQAQAARALKPANRVALTGTPVENRLSELWSIMNFLNPGYLGSEAGFRREYARPIERTGDQESRERLRKLTTPFILRRLKTDKSIISDLPEKMEMKVYCSLTREQATLYQAVVQDYLEKIEASEGVERRGQVLAMLMRLKQICNHPAQYLQDGSALPGRSGKLARLVEMLEEAYASDDRALIFTQFASFGAMLQTYLSSTFYDDVLFLHGGTPAKERDPMVQRFQADWQGAPRAANCGPRIFILSLKAGGTGLNLTSANHVFHYDRWWNPAVENQATDRAFRIGQTRNVQVHKFICGGTLEDHIDEMIESKRELAESVIGDGESWLTELSTAQLRDLVTLRQADVEESE